MDLCNRRDVSLLSSRSSPTPSLFRHHTCLPLTRKPPSPVPLPTMGAAALHRRATGSPFADPSPQRQGLGGWRTPPPVRDGCSTKGPQGGRPSQAGACSAKPPGNSPVYQPRRGGARDRSPEPAAFTFQPGTHFQNFVLKNFFCPVVRPLVPVLPVHVF